MRVAASVARSGLRRQAVALAGVALIVALGGGVAVGALVAADRTNRAYPDYVRSAGVGDLGVNPAQATRAVDRVMRGLPGVRSVHSDFLFTASYVATHAGRVKDFGDTSDFAVQVRGSTD